MTKFYPENERMKRKYFEWEKEANGKSDSTIANIEKYIYEFEAYRGFKDFKPFAVNDAKGFKKHISQKRRKLTGELVSKSYQLHALKSLSNFFKWLHLQPGYKKAICNTAISYLRLSEKDIQVARAPKTDKEHPTLAQIELVVRSMCVETEVQKRDQAVVAFLALTGCRVSALASLKLKHVSLEKERIEQHPQDVKTKGSKRIVTYFLPVGDYLKGIFIDWVKFMESQKFVDYNAPLFPSTKLTLDENGKFSRQELDIVAWQSTTSIRTILKEAFEEAGLKYFRPHSFRDTAVQLGYDRCKTPEDFKAWSQNLGHSSPLTTFTSYGHIEDSNQGAIIKRLTKDNGSEQLFTSNQVAEMLKAVGVNKDRE